MSYDRMNALFNAFFNDLLATNVYEANKAKGFWDKERNEGEIIALIHSEISEAFDVFELAYDIDLTNSSCSVIKNLTMQTKYIEELADVVIRILDYMGGKKYNILSVVRHSHPLYINNQPSYICTLDYSPMKNDWCGVDYTIIMECEKFINFVLFSHNVMHSKLTKILECVRTVVDPTGQTTKYYKSEDDKNYHISRKCTLLLYYIQEYIYTLTGQHVLLEKAVLEKLEYNKSREYKHGKKF